MAFLEVHVLQSMAAANLNRDDANSIKTIEFGGYERQRISSQCFKRALRESEFFEKAVRGRGVRTKKLADAILKSIKIDKPTKEQETALYEFLKGAGFGESEAPKRNQNAESSKDPGLEKLKTLFFAANEEIAKAAAILKDTDFDVKKSVSQFKKERKKLPLSEDIALFGRMAASAKELSVDAAAQVAHAISVNHIEIVDDFYTALDDLARDEDAGSSMMGTTQIASPCFYRYACVSLNTLRENLGCDEDATQRALKGFLDGFVKAIPGGKRTGTAPNTVPDLIMISVGKAQPMSLVNAFERPVQGQAEKAISQVATERLFRYLERLNKVYDWTNSRKAFYVTTQDERGFQGIVEWQETFAKLIAAALENVSCSYGD